MMKFKILANHAHQSVNASATWINNNETLSVGDDHTLMKWNILSNITTESFKFQDNVYPTKLKSSIKHIPGRLLYFLATSDGSAYYLDSKGKVEVALQGIHKGAVLSISMSPNGQEVLTTGEDGFVKTWSLSGSNRLILAKDLSPIYASTWSPNSNSIIYSCGHNIIYQRVVADSSGKCWVGHNGLVLALSWNTENDLILSGGEDFVYKIWNVNGQVMFTSLPLKSPITSLSWAPLGNLFAVGVFNSILLCNKYGAVLSPTRHNFGSLYDMEWALDGTRVIGASASGNVLLATLLNRKWKWDTITVLHNDDNLLTLSDINEPEEHCSNVKHRVLLASIRKNFLVVVTQDYIIIYDCYRLEIATTLEMRVEQKGKINLILQNNRQFVVCAGDIILVYNYEGRVLGQIKWHGIRVRGDENKCAMSPDLIAFIDTKNPKIIRLFDPWNGKDKGKVEVEFHAMEISFAQNEYPGMKERLLSIIDSKKELHLLQVMTVGRITTHCLGKGVTSMKWNWKVPILAYIEEGKRLKINYFPQALFSDPTMLENTSQEILLSPEELDAKICGYFDDRIDLSCKDATFSTKFSNPFIKYAYKYSWEKDFSEALKISRYIDGDKMLWGIVGCLASLDLSVAVAQACFEEIEHYDKVHFIRDIQDTPQDVLRKAQAPLLIGGVLESESMLIQSGSIALAIQLNVNTHRWERALELAIKHNIDSDFVLKARKEFLNDTKITETLPLFLEVAENQKAEQKHTKKKSNIPTKSS